MQPLHHRYVFVGGLHRSGTTPLARCLASHPQVSGFSGTTAPEDEGQHLQSVYPAAIRYGGPGRFALQGEAHLTEASPLATPTHREQLLADWRPHWDLARPVLVEKSPPNVVMTRYLQELVPEAYFIMIIRNPVIVSLSTAKWAPRTGLVSLMKHWFAAHDLLRADAAMIRRLRVVTYERLVTSPETVLGGLADFLELDGPIPTQGVQRHRSTSYQQRWAELTVSRHPWHRRNVSRLRDRYSERVQEYGYSLDDLDAVHDFPDGFGGLGTRHRGHR
jgi:hypothetical protein